ncbi:hypothetical protein GQ55_4G287200 [Panicum hallii var. hallii]|uniref:Uncharacterized protein n=1 Tax=Panicum hallii var. hallii TaxID=1504633 RepID=A0A2T7E176_9POAL|nr:hypothetical protein GQ55_4G287200 [Panicum hallii var. hallii]
MRAKTQKSLSNRSLITPPTDEATLFPPPTLTRRSSFAELSSGDDANGRPSSTSMELSPRRPQRFPRARSSKCKAGWDWWRPMLEAMTLMLMSSILEQCPTNKHLQRLQGLPHPEDRKQEQN